MKVLKHWLITSLLALVSCISVVATAHADIEEAVSYLTMQQSADGSFGTGTVSVSQATSEALRAFFAVDQGNQSDITVARTFLDSVEQSNTEHISRLLVVKAQAGEDVQTLVNTLLQRQNSDGGFGNFSGYYSDVFDTAIVLEALVDSEQVFTSTTLSNTNAALSAVSFLRSKQNIDGSWSLRTNDASVFMSAVAMRALWLFKRILPDIADDIRKTQSYLLAQRDINTGLWPQTFESALALIAIIPNINEFSQIDSIVSNLRGIQQANGSWDNDTFTTALVIRALNSQPTPILPIAGTGTVSGKIINAQTKQAIKAVSVSIGSISLNTASSGTGIFNLMNISPGLDYSIDISLAGYSPVRLDSVDVDADKETNLGLIEISPLPGTGVLQGIVSDANTGQPLDGVSVTLTGNSVASTDVLSDGSYSLAGLNLGNTSVIFSLDGYQALVVNADIIDSRTLVLSPSLTPIGTQYQPLAGAPDKGLLRGQVTDAITGFSLASAEIRISGSGNERYQQSDVDGLYEISDLLPGDIQIVIANAGYSSTIIDTTVFAGNAIRLNPQLVPSTENLVVESLISLESLLGTPVTGMIQGLVSDLQTGLPLSGVGIVVSGSSTASAITGIDGSFAILNLLPGKVSIRASIDNYLDVVVTNSVIAGNKLIFNPQLTPDNYVSSQLGSVVGRVVNTLDNFPLNQALVTVTKIGSAEQASVSTGTDGRYRIDDLSPGNYTISFSAPGYLSRGIDIAVIGGGKVDLKSTELQLALNTVTLFGQIRDEITDELLENVFISVANSALQTQSDTDGLYRIHDIAIGNQTFLINATGYKKQTITLNFIEGGQYELNRELVIAQSPGLDINAIRTDQASYKAYAPIIIEADVFNNSTLINAAVSFSLYNVQEELVIETMGIQAETLDTQIAFPAGQLTTVFAEINTTNLPPGEYRLIGRVIQGVYFQGQGKSSMNWLLSSG